LLAGYRWPGNVRELVNALEHAVVLARGGTIEPADLPDRLAAPPPSQAPAREAQSLDEVERRHIVEVLRESTTLEEAAARLGINPTTLWRKRKRYRID
jgi:NtrC-family two-component system response regulator AlgB